MRALLALALFLSASAATAHSDHPPSPAIQASFASTTLPFP